MGVAEQQGVRITQGKDRLINADSVQLLSLTSRSEPVVLGLAEVSVGDTAGKVNGWVRVRGVYRPWATPEGIEDYIEETGDKDLVEIDSYSGRFNSPLYRRIRPYKTAEIDLVMDQALALSTEQRRLAIGTLIQPGSRRIARYPHQYAFWKEEVAASRGVEDALLRNYLNNATRNGGRK